jgi:hypothetical protein
LPYYRRQQLLVLGVQMQPSGLCVRNLCNVDVKVAAKCAELCVMHQQLALQDAHKNEATGWLEINTAESRVFVTRATKCSAYH